MKGELAKSSKSWIMTDPVKSDHDLISLSEHDLFVQPVPTFPDHALSLSSCRATEQEAVRKEAKTDAELEDMILQRLVIGGVFVSVRRDPILGWRPTVVTAPRHTRNAQELADKIAADLRKSFTLKD
jgi:hypothetical protein